jgi:hypothetical protein
MSEEPETMPFELGEPELSPQEEPFPAAEEPEAGEEPAEENPDDEVFLPEDTTLELSPDEEEQVLSDETFEDPAAQESEDSLLDSEPDSGIPVEAPAPEEEPAFETALKTGDVPGEEAGEEFIPIGDETEEEMIPGEEPAPEEEAFAEEEFAAGEEPIPGEEPVADDVSVLEEVAPEDKPGLKEETAAGEDSSGPNPDKPLEAESIVKLLNHLKGLAHGLPDKDVEQFLNSDVRLSLEFLIDVLQGRKGLYKDIKERLGEDKKTPENGEPAGAPPATQVAGTLTYLEHLASALPDQTLSAVITRKTDAVIAGIRQNGETKGSVKKG